MPSTPEFLADLDIDQLRRCRELCDEKIKAKTDERKRVVWMVVSREGLVESMHKEEDYAKAWESLVTMQSEFLKLAERVLAPGQKGWINHFYREAPHIDAQLYPESEYATLEFAP